MAEATVAKDVTTVLFEVFRYHPSDGAPRMARFDVPVPKGMTILEALHWIKENEDQSLSYRYSCRMGVCGSCGMFINGFPRLACTEQVLKISKERIRILPLPNYDIIRDLVPDLRDFFEKHRAVKPWILRRDLGELEAPTGEFYQSREELRRYLQFAYCIKCGCCTAACPTAATDSKYLGPQALGQAHRYNADTRDEGQKERNAAVDNPGGPWRCHFAGACTEACPKGVDPAMAIQLLKADITWRKLGLRRPKTPAGLVKQPTDAKRREGVPDAPEPTVES